METIKSKIVENRPKIGEQTVKTYVSLLHAIYKKTFPTDTEIDINRFKEVDKIMKFANTKAPSTRRTYLASLVVLLDKGEEMEQYRNQMLADIKTHQEEEDTQLMTERQKENWMEYGKIREIWETMNNEMKPILNKRNLIELTNDQERKLNDFMLLTITSGIYFPPQRSKEWSDLKMKNVNPESDNWVDMKHNRFIFNKHKNESKTGMKSVSFPPQFKTLLTKYMKYNKSEYLIHTHDNKQLTSIQMSKHLNNIFDKKISTSMLRHIYLTEMEKSSPTLAERKSTAKEMGHSMNVAMTYVKK